MLKERSAFWACMNVVEIISNSIKKISPDTVLIAS